MRHIRRPRPVMPHINSTRMTRKKSLAMPLERASEIMLLDCEARNLTKDRIRFVAQVHQRFLAFLRERHKELGASPPVTALTPEYAREFLAWLKQHSSRNPFSGEQVQKHATTIRAHLADLKAFSRFCSDEGYLKEHALQRMKLPKVEIKVIETFKAHHLEAMLKIVDGQLQRDRNRLIIYLLLSTGMRASELCNLTRNDVDLRSRTVKVFGKGRKERLVRIDPTTAKLLARFLAEQKDQGPEARLFLSRYGKPLNRLALYRVIDKLGQDAGITDVRVSPHTFRHTFSVQFLRAHPGAIFHLMDLLGHTNPMMTRRYSRLAEAEANLEGPGPIEALGLDKLIRR